jgi:hypothetical protein
MFNIKRFFRWLGAVSGTDDAGHRLDLDATEALGQIHDERPWPQPGETIRWQYYEPLPPVHSDTAIFLKPVLPSPDHESHDGPAYRGKA